MARTRHAASVTKALKAARLCPIPAGSKREGWLTVAPDTLGYGATVTVRKPDDLTLDQAAFVVADALYRGGHAYRRNEERATADGTVVFEFVHEKTKHEIAEELAMHCRAWVRRARQDGATGTRISADTIWATAQELRIDADAWLVRRAARLIVDELQRQGELDLVDFSHAPFTIRLKKW